MMLWITAWRNLWRNKRRTIIITAAIVVGLLGIMIFMAYVNTWMQQTVENAAGIKIGHVQIQAPAYHDNPQLKYSIPHDPALRTKLLAAPKVKGAGARIKAQVFARNPRKAEVTTLYGTDPAHEADLSMTPASVLQEWIRLPRQILEEVQAQNPDWDKRPAMHQQALARKLHPELAEPSRWLREDDDKGIVIGSDMAKRFNAGVGSRITLRGSRPDGEVTGASFAVVGVFNTGLQEFDRTTVYVTLTAAQELFQMQGRVTEWVVNAEFPEDSWEVKAGVEPLATADEMVVTTWQEQEPLIVKMMAYTNKFMWIFYGFFYVAMAFGIANTMLMSVMERKREIGMMLALGVRRRTILGVILAEAAFLALFAGIIGAALSYAIIRYFEINGLDLTAYIEGMSYFDMRGVMYPFLTVRDFLSVLGVTVGVAMAMAFYPAYKASRLVPTVAIRNQ